MTFPNYWLWTAAALVISVYNYFGTDWKNSKIDPVYWIAMSFIPMLHVISWIANLVYLGENQHLLLNNKLNRLLGFVFEEDQDKQ